MVTLTIVTVRAGTWRRYYIREKKKKREAGDYRDIMFK